MSDNTSRPEGQRIIITRNFDQTDKIGYLQLRPGIEIPPDTHLALGYTVADAPANTPIKKISVHEVSLVSDSAKKDTAEKPVHWIEDEIDAGQGLCILNSTDKQYRCYCKFDEMIHFWFYGDEYGFNCDTGEYGMEARKTGHHEYYWCIGGIEELDKAIAQLQAIKTSATEWYAKRGKQWPPDWDAYTKGDKTWEQALTLEKMSNEQQ